MADWNEQGSRNNNVQPRINLKQESLEEKRIQMDVIEENRLEHGKNVKPQVKQE